MRGPRRAWLVVAVVAMTLGVTWKPPGARADDPGRAARVNEVLQQYMRDPLKSRRLLRRLGREAPDDLGPGPEMALADSDLRTGRLGSAHRRFEAVLAGHPGEPWEGWAHLGLGWIEMARDRLGAARRHYRAVADSGSPSRSVARFILAVIAASEGDTDAAQAALTAVEASTPAGSAVRNAAVVAHGYVQYWSGDFAGAAEAFADATRKLTDGRFIDDARYGEARARLEAGDERSAREILESLARDPSLRRRPERGVVAVDLDRELMLRAGFSTYRKGPVVLPDDQAAGIFDLDGVTLAEALLRRLDAPAPAAASARATPVAMHVEAPVGARPASTSAGSPRGPIVILVGLMGGVAVLLAVVVRRMRA